MEEVRINRDHAEGLSIGDIVEVRREDVLFATFEIRAINEVEYESNVMDIKLRRHGP